MWFFNKYTNTLTLCSWIRFCFDQHVSFFVPPHSSSFPGTNYSAYTNTLTLCSWIRFVLINTCPFSFHHTPPPSPEPTTRLTYGQTHMRDSNHDRYLPCRWSRTSYLGVPRCPSRLGLRENTVSIRQFFLHAPFAPPAHTGVSIPLRLPSHLQPHSRDRSPADSLL